MSDSSASSPCSDCASLDVAGNLTRIYTDIFDCSRNGLELRSMVSQQLLLEHEVLILLP